MRLNRILLFVVIFSLLGLTVHGCSEAKAAAEAQADASKDLLDELTFLGDSTTAHMQLRSSLRTEQIWAAKNRYLNLDSRITYARIVAPDTNEEESIATVAKRLKPRYLVITLGIDYGVYYYREDLPTFRYYYEKLLSAIEEASPETTLILQSVFPVGRGAAVITNTMIANANAVIGDIARARGLTFIDQTAVLSDADGFLKEEYCYSDDGIHLTAAAYDAILQRLLAAESEIRGAI